MTPVVGLLALVVFAAASFGFALAETALFSLGKWQIKQLEEHHPVQGALIARLLARPQDLLATLVLGNTVANAALVGIVLWVILEQGSAPLFAASALLLGFIVLGGEVTPKTLAVRTPETWALRVARPTFLLVEFTRPVRAVAQWFDNWLLRVLVPKTIQPQTTISDEEYQELIELAFQQGALGASEKEIILQIINLDRHAAKDVMKPRSTMACISDDCSVQEMIEAARRHGFQRLPVYDETPDTIVGILNTRILLMNPGIDLDEAIEFPSFVPESMNLLQLFKSLQRQQRGLAIVLDEFGGTAGIVTMEDILEELVGKIRREPDEARLLERLGDGRWRVNGALLLDDFGRECQELGEVSGVDTVSGLLVREKEVVPAVGESVQFRGLRFTVQAADERRVREVLIERTRRRG
jgi:putative hemolysin